jgi:hypothetical protein
MLYSLFCSPCRQAPGWILLAATVGSLECLPVGTAVAKLGQAACMKLQVDA